MSPSLRPPPRLPGLRRRALLGGTAAVAWLAPGSRAADLLTVHMGYADSLWPLAHGKDGGAVEGLLVDAMRLVGARAGVEMVHEAYPWARAQLMVARGDLDGFCTARTQERQAYALFAATPLASFSFGVFHRAKDTRPLAVRSVADLRALRQGTYRGNGYARENLEIDRMRLENDEDSVLRLIAMDRLDVFAGIEFVVVPRLVRLGLYDRMRFTPLAFLPPVEYRFGLRKTFPEAEAVLARVEAATQAARKAGELEALLKRYQQTLRGVVGNAP